MLVKFLCDVQNSNRSSFSPAEESQQLPSRWIQGGGQQQGLPLETGNPRDHGPNAGHIHKQVRVLQQVITMAHPTAQCDDPDPRNVSPNRSYRDSLKDAQSKVLRSTSFRRRDLTSSGSAQPAPAPPSVSSSGSQQPPPVPPKYHSLEKKGPTTMPKPRGIVITPQSQPLVTSPHTPKERHLVTPDVRGSSPPPLPSVPPVGQLPSRRICGRKRLTADQKKRSYSEPENMNEVGISDPETMSLFRRGGGKISNF